MTEDLGIISIQEIAEKMKELGDSRKKTAIEMQIRRALDDGAFPGSVKINPKSTSSWVIKRDVAEDWLAEWLEGRKNNVQTEQASVGNDDAWWRGILPGRRTRQR